jgi:hypothetical protein
MRVVSKIGKQIETYDMPGKDANSAATRFDPKAQAGITSRLAANKGLQPTAYCGG